MTYLHDFFVTERHVIFLLHPVEFSPFAFLAGMESFTDSLSWAPAQGNLAMVVEKAAGATPMLFEAPAAFMWHSLNAYEDGTDIVADFVGYDDPDHFIGDNPVFKTVMQGETGENRFPGTVRRYRIDLAKRRLTEEVVDKGHHECPLLDPRVALQRHRYGFVATGEIGDWTLDGVARLDMGSGQRTEFRFGPKHFVGEPIFAPSGPAEGQGWLLAQVQSGETGRSFLAIFDAETLEDGPVAKVMLNHHVPLSFHGFWQAG
jgi:all-trans-8'-apo-beta-carotenal 15,15'-oxygenase